MRIQAGWRYRAVITGDEYEGLLTEPAPPDTWQEGGGEIVMQRWILTLDDGTSMDVQEVSLNPMQPRGLGPQPGPIYCPACKGKGSRPKPGGLTPSLCTLCGGEGITYPEDA